MKRTKINPVSAKQKAKNAEWKKSYTWVMENRARGRCEGTYGEGYNCRNTAFLSPHHIKPKGRYGVADNSIENCEILCQECHQRRHGQ